MRERMQQFEREQPDKLVVVDVPLLFESGLQAMFERTLVVYIPAELQLERLIRRDGLTPEQAEQRIRAQMPIEEKKRLADYVIDNSDSLASTEQQIDAFWRTRGLP
jgi:dephospho-CoA kinase